jgi:DNA-binding transcriptional regulator YiaG
MTPDEIQAIRQLMGWEQKDMARHLKCTERAVRAWEAGWRNPPGPVEVALRYLMNERSNETQAQAPEHRSPHVPLDEHGGGIPETSGAD